MNTKEYPDISIQIGKINQIIGPNNAGKTFLCNVLYDGFQGKLKKQFIFDGNNVEKKDYFVYYIKDIDTIDLEKKLGAKSHVKSRIVSAVEGLDEAILTVIENKISELSNKIEDTLLKEVEVFEGLTLKFDMDIKDILLKNITLEIKNNTIDEISYSNKRLSYIELLLDIIEKTHQPSILIIDGIDNGLSKYSVKKVLQGIEKKQLNETIVFYSTTSYIESYPSIYVYQGQVTNTILDEKEVFSWFANKNSSTIMEIKELYSEEEIINQFQKLNIEKEVREYFISNFTLDTKYSKLLKIQQ